MVIFIAQTFLVLFCSFSEEILTQSPTHNRTKSAEPTPDSKFAQDLQESARPETPDPEEDENSDPKTETTEQSSNHLSVCINKKKCQNFDSLKFQTYYQVGTFLVSK